MLSGDVRLLFGMFSQSPLYDIDFTLMEVSLHIAYMHK
ncbi:hypothetical protein Mpsy_1893 [Methanolobus psychrophilus R15]|nr:hypothetical protein Mpsy_1893 [Methanolobus psychrophilus R15]